MYVVHHADLDGECAAAVVSWYARGLSEWYNCKPTFVPMDYKDPLPAHAFKRGMDTYIVDFSFQRPGDWEQVLASGANVIWIDHHKTAIERASEIPEVAALPGLRREGCGAGCELAWEYLFPGQPMPRAVALIGDYDTWTFAHGDETRRFKAYLEAMHDTRPDEGWQDTWQYLIPSTEAPAYSHWTAEMWARALYSGQRLLNVQAANAAHDVKAWGFEVELDGLRGIALNRRQVGSDYFASVAGDYDVLLPFAFDGKQWTVSIYRGGAAGAETVDCAALAKQFGGGGHPGASGFQCLTLPWEATD